MYALEDRQEIGRFLKLHEGGVPVWPLEHVFLSRNAHAEIAYALSEELQEAHRTFRCPMCHDRGIARDKRPRTFCSSSCKQKAHRRRARKWARANKRPPGDSTPRVRRHRDKAKTANNERGER